MTAPVCLQAGRSQIVTGVAAAADSQPAVTSQSQSEWCLPACLPAVPAAPIDLMSGFHAFPPRDAHLD